MSPAEAAVIAAATQTIKAGRAYWLADRACQNRQDKSLAQFLSCRGLRALAEVANNDAELQLGEAVDALEKERATP